jgi:hypothetical protein
MMRKDGNVGQLCTANLYNARSTVGELVNAQSSEPTKSLFGHPKRSGGRGYRTAHR